MSGHPVLLYGHRGAPAECPENTVASFERALALGVDAIETDIHMTSDGHLIVHHDATGARTCGVDAAVRTLPLAEIQTWDAGGGHQVPTFQEVLERFPDTFFNVDLKQPDPPIVSHAMALIARMGATHRVRLASVQDVTIRRIRRAGYAGPVGIAKHEILRWFFTPAAVATRAFWRGKQRALQIPTHAGPLRLDTGSRIEKGNRCGWRVDFWTINDPDEATRLLKLGADGIMTDDPALVAPAVRAFRGH